VEFGWIVSPAVYGDNQPHMFVDFQNGGIYAPYNGAFVPYPGSPSLTAALPYGDGSLHTYGIVHSAGKWWFYHDGYFLGYIPDSAWQYPVGTPDWAQNGGEVEGNSPSCSKMGSGIRGNATSGRAASWTNTYYIEARGYEHNATSGDWTVTDPNAWSLGNASASPNGASFTYGGPGYTGC
jgi:hypothetical protein